MRNGVAKKLENFASKNTREFILRHPVQKIILPPLNAPFYRIKMDESPLL
jgi:hypothetical protein